MNRNMSANVAGMAGAMAMMGLTMASRKLGFTHGEMLPKEATEAALGAADMEQEVSETQEQALGLGAHLGFSMSSALLYARVRHFVGLPGAVTGMLFGLALWGVNVAGVGTMLGLRQSPTRSNDATTATTIAAHLVFGLVLGLLYDALVDEDDAR